MIYDRHETCVTVVTQYGARKICLLQVISED